MSGREPLRRAVFHSTVGAANPKRPRPRPGWPRHAKPTTHSVLGRRTRCCQTIKLRFPCATTRVCSVKNIRVSHAGSRKLFTTLYFLYVFFLFTTLVVLLNWSGLTAPKPLPHVVRGADSMTRSNFKHWNVPSGPREVCALNYVPFENASAPQPRQCALSQCSLPQASGRPRPARPQHPGPAHAAPSRRPLTVHPGGSGASRSAPRLPISTKRGSTPYTPP